MITGNRDLFVKALAKFLVENEGEMSIGLELGKLEAKRWRDLRSVTPLFGYHPGPDGVERAEKILRVFLWGEGV